MSENYQLNLEKSKSRNKLLVLMSKYDLIDIWRFQNEDKRQFTWQRGKQKSKLDYFLISSGFLNIKINSDILFTPLTDHKLLTCLE